MNKLLIAIFLFITVSTPIQVKAEDKTSESNCYVITDQMGLTNFCKEETEK